MVLLPLATSGSNLLALGVEPRPSALDLVTAHVMFTISYVVVTVRARLQGMDGQLEEAAADLYAGTWATLLRVTLPLALSGVASAGLLAFALSFDDFVVTNFVSADALP